jgi:sortase A
VNLPRGTLKRPRRRGSTIVRAAYYLFLTVGIVALGYAGYVVADEYIYQEVEAAKFEFATKDIAPVVPTEPDTAAPPTVPTASVPKHVIGDDGLIGELEIPRLEMKIAVVQGDSEKILRRAVGHLPSSAMPGDMGNVALAGHRDTFFRPLRKIGPGDAITLKTYDGDFEYRVESVEVVAPSNVEVLKPTGSRTLTLITCFPFNYVGSAPNRFIVRATQLDGSSPPVNP